MKNVNENPFEFLGFLVDYEKLVYAMFITNQDQLVILSNQVQLTIKD